MIKNIIPFIINSDGTKRSIYRPTLRARNTHTNIIQVIAPFDFNTNIGITYSLKNSSADTHTEYAVLTDFKGSDVLSPDRPDYQELADFNVWELTVSHVPLNGIVLNRSYSVDLTFNIFDTVSEQLDHSVYFGLNGDLPEELEPNTIYINDRINFYSERIGRRLYLNESFKLNEEELIVRAHTATILTNTTKETVTVESSLLRELPESVPPIGIDFNALADKMYEMKHFYQFYSVDEFPIEGEERILYLAQFENLAPEGDEEKWESSNALYKWDTEAYNYELISAGGTGGGGGGTGGASRPRLTPYPVGSPTSLNVSFGTEVIVQYNYVNDIYTTGSRGIYVNDTLVNTRNISTGVNTEDITQYLRIGLNTVRFRVSDPEGTAAALIFTINMDTVVFTSLFNDSVANVGTPFSIPFNINTSAQVRELYVKVDGIDKPMRTVIGTAGLETISGLTHGAHDVEMYVIARFLNAENVELYSIQSNTLRFALIYDDGISTDRIITSKFNITESAQGENLNIDYVVYDPELETSPVSLYINSELFNSLTVDRTRHFWNIRTLPIGTHTLRIESGSTYIDKVVKVIPTEIVVEVIKDEFLKLYMIAEGKTNSDANRDDWDNSWGAPVDVNLTNLNYSSNGWINNSLRLSKDASAEIIYKAFNTEVTTSGKTIELDFRTRFSLDINTPLLSSMNGGVGFEITPQRATLYGSNVTAIANFKEDEHLRISFVINPVERFITTYVNGIITGVDNYFNNTSFRQISPANILLNPEDGSIDVYSIRVYDRALTSQEILNNQIAEITDPLEKIEVYKFNDIYDSFGNINIDKIAGLIPIMKIEGNPLPDSKIRPRRFVDVYFEHPFEPDKNFERTGRTTDIDAQGTSSLQYPVKNFKIRLDQALSSSQRKRYQMEDNMIPERVFTLKADYMDSSHANNTGLAKLFDTIYDENIPPKDFDERVRTTVYGYPIVLFHRVNPSDPWTYKGVYNFNLDKDAEDSVGLNNEDEWEEGNPESVFPDNQSFEITFNSDSGAGAFKVSDLNGMISSFEPRYPELDAFDIFEDENITADQMMEETREHMLTLTTDPTIILEIEESATPEELIDIWDANFTSLENYAYIEAFRDLRDHYANLREAIQWVIDNVSSNNFKTQFDQHFNKESALKYLISTLVFGLVDNLGKNAMVNTWDGNIWYFNFYDIDTALGLENQGRNIHDYDIEIGDPEAYATADSNMWIGILNHFGTELRSVYSGLRQGKYDYDNILEFLNEQQIDKIPESLYNADAFAKYIGVTTAWLWMAQGNRLEHIKRWLTLRLAYLDSKFQYGDYLDNNIAIRMNVDDYTDATVDLTPLISQYVGVRFGNVGGGIIINERTKQRETTTISAPAAAGSGITNMEVWIYGSNWLESIGDISNLYPSSVSTDNADKLTELIVGNQSIGYDNDKLTQVSVGSNIYLEKIDVSNCSILGTNVGTGSTEVLDLSLAENIKEVYAHGTQLKGVSLSPGAPIETLKLPASITELVLRNHNNLTPEGLDILGYDNITTFRTESLKNIDAIAEFNKTSNVQRLRMTGLEYSLFGLDYINDLIDKIWDEVEEDYTVLGIASDGSTIDSPVITGTVKVLTEQPIPQSEILRIKSILPNINIIIKYIENTILLTDEGDYISFNGYTGSATSLLIPTEYNIDINDDNPVVLGLVDGWKPIQRISDSALSNSSLVEIVIPDGVTHIGSSAFSGADDFQIITIPISVTNIGEEAFSGNMSNVIIVVENEEIPTGWHPNWNTNSEAIVVMGGLPTRTFVFNTKGGTEIENITSGYLTPAMIPEPYLYGYNSSGWEDSNGPISFPYIPAEEAPLTINLEVGEWEPWVYEVRYFLPDNSIYYTQYVEFSNSLGSEFTDIDKGGLNEPTYDSQIFKGWYTSSSGGTKLTSSYLISQDVLVDGYIVEFYGQFLNTQGLVFTYQSGDDVYDVTGFSLTNTSMNNGSINLFVPATFDDGINGEKYVRNINLTSATTTHKNKVGSIIIEANVLTNRILPSSAFSSYLHVTEIEIPYGFTSIGYRAFRGCSSLTSITIPESVTSISYETFYGCSSLTSITIPEGVTRINYEAFYGCSSLTSITIPESVTSISFDAFRGCSSLVSVNLLRNNLTTEMFNNRQFAGTLAVFNITSTQNAISLTPNNRGVMNLAQTELIVYPSASGDFVWDSNIPESVTSISFEAFRGCSSLISVTIPSGVTSIGSSAFRDCTQLEAVNLLPTTPPSLSNVNAFSNNKAGITFYVPLASETAYKTATNWSSFTSVIEGV